MTLPYVKKGRIDGIEQYDYLLTPPALHQTTLLSKVAVDALYLAQKQAAGQIAPI